MRFTLILLLSLQSCSMMDVLDVVKPSNGLSVDTELVIGDKQQEVAKGAVIGKKQTTTTTNTAERLEQVFYDNRVDEGTSIWDMTVMLIMALSIGLLIGWLWLPSYKEMRKASK